MRRKFPLMNFTSVSTPILVRGSGGKRRAELKRLRYQDNHGTQQLEEPNRALPEVGARGDAKRDVTSK